MNHMTNFIAWDHRNKGKLKVDTSLEVDQMDHKRMMFDPQPQG